MRRRPPNRAVRIVTLLTLAAALLLLCVGGIALQQTGASAESQGSHGSPGVVAGHAALDGPHLPASVESPDSEETLPVGSEHLNTLVLGLFLVSLGLLLGARLAGQAAERRLLELLRLPSVLPLVPARAPLSALEVFRL